MSVSSQREASEYEMEQCISITSKIYLYCFKDQLRNSSIVILPPADPNEVVKAPSIDIKKFPVFVTTTFTTLADSGTSYAEGLMDTIADSTMKKKPKY